MSSQDGILAAWGNDSGCAAKPLGFDVTNAIKSDVTRPDSSQMWHTIRRPRWHAAGHRSGGQRRHGLGSCEQHPIDLWQSPSSKLSIQLARDKKTVGRMKLAARVPGWENHVLCDRWEMIRFRVRAARYGLGFSSRPTASDLLTYATTVAFPLATIVVATRLTVASRLFVAGLVMAVAIVLLVWWHSHLPRIFAKAATSDRYAQELRRDLRAGLGNAPAYDLIKTLYQEAVTDANAELALTGTPEGFGYVATAQDVTFACIACPMDDPTSLRSLLVGAPVARSTDWHEAAERFAEARQDLISRWRHIDDDPRADDETGWNLVLEEFSGTPLADGRIQWEITTAHATYGQIVRTSDALLNEFALFAYLVAPRRRQSTVRRWLRRPRVLRQVAVRMRLGEAITFTSERAMLAALPWRRTIHRRSARPADIFLRPTGRAAGLGVAVTTLMPDRDGRCPAWLGLRSKYVGTYPDVLHVIPAGMCNSKDVSASVGALQQPVAADFIEATMWSEFFEEWKGVREFENLSSHQWRRLISEHRHADDLLGTEIVLTGLAFDLLNLRPEICAVLRLPRDVRSDLNYEYAARTPPHACELADLDELRSCVGYVQSGLASLALAQLAIDGKRVAASRLPSARTRSTSGRSRRSK